MKLLLNNILTSWKTSLLGVCLLIGGTCFCWVGQWEIGGGFLTVGLKALISKDYDADEDHERLEKLENKNAQLIEIVRIMQNLNSHKNAEYYKELNYKLKQLTENE